MADGEGEGEKRGKVLIKSNQNQEHKTPTDKVEEKEFTELC